MRASAPGASVRPPYNGRTEASQELPTNHHASQEPPLSTKLYYAFIQRGRSLHAPRQPPAESLFCQVNSACKCLPRRRGTRMTRNARLHSIQVASPLAIDVPSLRVASQTGRRGATQLDSSREVTERRQPAKQALPAGPPLGPCPEGGQDVNGERARVDGACNA